MKINFLSSVIAFYFFSFSFHNLYYPSSTSFSNNEITSSEESSFYYVLDNRYKGGSDVFIEDFGKNVSYPKEAFDNCRVGLSKIKFTISKDGEFENLEISNQLGMGIEEKLNDFFESIKGNWKAWARSSDMEMTVGFSLITQKDSYYPDADLLVLEKSAFKWATDNEYCDPDAKLQKRLKKYMKKKKFDKALPFAEELLRRHPDNTEFKNNLELIQLKKK